MTTCLIWQESSEKPHTLSMKPERDNTPSKEGGGMIVSFNMSLSPFLLLLKTYLWSLIEIIISLWTTRLALQCVDSDTRSRQGGWSVTSHMTVSCAVFTRAGGVRCIYSVLRCPSMFCCVSVVLCHCAAPERLSPVCLMCVSVVCTDHPDSRWHAEPLMSHCHNMLILIPKVDMFWSRLQTPLCCSSGRVRWLESHFSGAFPPPAPLFNQRSKTELIQTSLSWPYQP